MKTQNARPNEAQLAIMRQRSALLANIRRDRVLLKNCLDYEREKIERRIEIDLAALRDLPTIAVAVNVYLDIADDNIGHFRVVTESPDYIAVAVARAVVLNPSWANEINNGVGNISARVIETIEIRPESDFLQKKE